ncbi:MAG: aminotransferase class I/II-fold pyridoxal phosphate-dependent enzyme [Anaerolineales bacterium]|nr:aminotransferase class I/II-fold pyridoxal phosphate-dependent enzyme [Anaerolineales bacterium]
MNLNAQFELFRQSPTVAMGDRISALKASGRKIVGLQQGDPDFTTPQAVIDVAVKALQSGLTHYGPSRGAPDLLSAIAHKLTRDEGVAYDPASEIIVTHGGIHAYFSAMQSVLNPGDEALIPDPTWATHVNLAMMLRAEVVRVPAPAEDGFIPSFDAWARAVTPKTRAIVLNYPSNPTGIVPTRAYLQKLQDFAKAHDLWVVTDEVYGSLYFEEKPASLAAFEGAKERTLIVQSLSKTYAMTGWRVGFLAAPAPVIENAIKAGQNSITCVAPFIQKAAAFALTDPGVQQATAQMRAAYARRRALVMKLSAELESERVRVTPPQGAFYGFLDLRAMHMNDVEMCERILEEKSVGLVPGSAFGDQGAGFIRMSFAASDEDVETGFRRIVEWAEAQ